MDPVRLILPDEAATIALGEDLALALKRGDCLALSGDLGAGKSTLARALLRAMADDDTLEVPSPTFTLVQTYDLRIAVSHFDLYRLTDPAELDELGFDEALDQGICLVEWPEQASGALPATRLTLTLTHASSGRHVAIDGGAAALLRVRRVLAIRTFLERSGFVGARRRHLSGDASTRAYEQIQVAERDPMILMDAERRAPGPILQDGKYYQQLAHIAEDVLPFVAIAEHLRDCGLAAPAIHAADIDAGILVLENLGSDGIVDADGQPIEERYRASVDLLAHLHGLACRRDLVTPDGRQHHIPDFDRTAIKIETQLLIDWYLPWKRGTAASDEERSTYAAIWDILVDRLEAAERHILLRDFHSPNIIWRGTRNGLDQVGVIDFQDAMIGPTAYDVASLVQDARVSLPPALTRSLLERYMSQREQAGAFDRVAFTAEWHIMATQRNCKLAGIWVRLLQRDGKPDYMRHLPRTFAYLTASLDHPVLRPLRDWCIQAAILPDESGR